VIQRQNDADDQSVSSYVAGILNLDLYRDNDDEDTMPTADVSTAADTHPDQPPPADDSAATV